MEQDTKYAFYDDAIVNRSTGQRIPEDEPVFVIRANDKHAIATIMHYQDLCDNKKHADDLNEVLRDFATWEATRGVKEPD